MRSTSAIQADLDAAYLARSDLVAGRVSSVSVPGHQTQFLSLTDLLRAIAALERELATANAVGEGATDGRASGFVINRMIRG